MTFSSEDPIFQSIGTLVKNTVQKLLAKEGTGQAVLQDEVLSKSIDVAMEAANMCTGCTEAMQLHVECLRLTILCSKVEDSCEMCQASTPGIQGWSEPAEWDHDFVTAKLTALMQYIKELNNSIGTIGMACDAQDEGNQEAGASDELYKGVKDFAERFDGVVLTAKDRLEEYTGMIREKLFSMMEKETVMANESVWGSNNGKSWKESLSEDAAWPEVLAASLKLKGMGKTVSRAEERLDKAGCAAREPLACVISRSLLGSPRVS